MSTFSVFQDFVSFRFSSKPPRGQFIYQAIVATKGRAFDMTPGTPDEAKAYAQAMGIARARYALERAQNQTNPYKAIEMLPEEEHDWGVIPSETATIVERQRALAAAQVLARGARREALEEGLRAILGSSFIALRVLDATEIEASSPTNVHFGRPDLPFKLIRLTSPIATLGSPITVDYERADLTTGPLPLVLGDVLTVQPDNDGLREVVVVLTATGTQFTATFTKAHDIDCLATTQSFVAWTSNQRSYMVIAEDAATVDAETRRKVDDFLAKASRGVTVWSLVQPTTDASPYSVGPFTLGQSPIGAVPLESLPFVPDAAWPPAPPAPPSLTLFDFDFTAPALGGMLSSDFTTLYPGLVFTRTSVSTVQTSASTLAAGLVADEAGFGSNGATRGLVIQHNTFNRIGNTPPNGFTGDNAPRDLTLTDWNPGSGSTVDRNGTHPSPDGTNTATRVQVSAGGYAPYGGPGLTSEASLTAWQRSKQLGTNDTMQMVWATNANVPGQCAVSAGNATYQRLTINDPQNPNSTIVLCDARDQRNLAGGMNATDRDVLIDYMQLEFSKYETEAIAFGLSQRTHDKLAYTGPIADGGRVKAYFRFQPKIPSATRAFWVVGTGTMGNVGSYYLLSFNGDGNHYIRINPTSLKLELKDGATTGTSSAAISWAAGDDVEIYFEYGGSSPAVASYRVNGPGAWTDFGLTTSIGAVSPSGAKFFYNDAGSGDTGDTGQLPVWARHIAFYTVLGGRPT